MRKISKIFTVLSLILVMGLGSCEKWIDPEMNISPNSPGDVPNKLILPATMASLAYVHNGDYARLASLYVQHLSGVDRQAAGFEVYSTNESDINNLWNTLYGATLKDLKRIRENAIPKGAIHYVGVANVLTAFTLGMLTDAWDDIPYSKALQGETNLKAEYDTQLAIYTTINTLLDEAIVELAKAAPAGIERPGTDDLIYRGNTALWLAAARSLKLRVALHGQKRAGNWTGVMGLVTAGGFITSNANNFQFNFGTPSTESGPVFNFDTNRGDIRVGASIVNIMNANADPRRPVYFSGAVTPGFTVPATYVGSLPGAKLTTANWPGPGFASRNSPAYLMTFAEVKFIEAEVRFRAGQAGSAAALRAAITASLEQYGVANPGWVTTNYGAITDATITIEQIITAKYTHLYMQPEAWNDWKRTNLPALAASAGNATGNLIPRRHVYPQDERLYNGVNMPMDKKVTDRVWWDM